MATYLASPTPTTRSLKGPRNWAWATLAFFVIVVLEGAVVRATSSGAGCGKNWPLCNGQILPHHPQLATVIEFTHRSLTGICTMMFAALIAWTFYATPRRHPARMASVVAGVLLLIEGALGAVLVLGGYVEKNASDMRVFVQGIHFTNTMLLLAASTVVAVLLGNIRLAPNPEGLKLPMRLALLATIITGATGSVAALADTLFPSRSFAAAIAADFAANSPLLIRMRWMHPATALIAAACTVWLILGFRKRGMDIAAISLTTNLSAQIVIGCLDVLLLAPTPLQVVHLLSADIFWISLVSSAVTIFRPTMKERLDKRKGAAEAAPF
jgi:cytochrome c oxidase assembly protein subunit 15